MGTVLANFLPNTTGLDLGSTSQRWDAFIQTEDVSGNSAIAGNQTIAGNETITGNLTVNGTTTLAGALASLTVTGNATIGGNETVGGTLAVTGNTTLSGTLGVTGTTTAGVVSATSLNKTFFADRYADINTACAAAVTAGGGTVLVPPGSYTVSSTVSVGGSTNHEPVELVFFPGTNISVTITNGTAAFRVYDGSAIRSRIGSSSYQGFGGAIAAGRILCSNTANVSAVITNGTQNGTQQSMVLENLWIGANSGTPTVTALVDIVGLASGTYCANLVIEQCTNSIGLRIQPPAAGIASVFEFRNLTINGLHAVGAQPVQIKNLAGNASAVSTMNFYSCDFEHSGASTPTVEINGNGGTTANGAQSINFYGCYIEGSTDATQLGFKLTDAHDCNFYGVSFLGGGGTCFDINDSGSTKTYNLNLNGIYNGNWATTVNDHINTLTYTDVSLTNFTYLGKKISTSSRIALVDLTAQTAAIGTTTLYTVPAGAAGQYRLSWNSKITTAAGTSSTLGPLTIVYTDPDAVAVTLTAAAAISAGTIATTSAANTTGTVLIGMPMLLNCKASTVISYATGYASNAANAMNYNLHIVLEKMSA